MSHRREIKKNKNAMVHEDILQGYLRELDNELENLRNRIKILKKLRDAIRWKLI